MSFGRYAHMAILEPDKLDLVKPLPESVKRRSGRDWEALQSDNPGITFLSPSEWSETGGKIESAKRVAESVYAHPIVADLMRDVEKECSMIWTDNLTGLRCKGRTDALAKSMKHIVDFKMTSRETPYQITRAAYGFGYHLQVGHYCRGLEYLRAKLTDKVLLPATFWFVFIEENPPHMILLANGMDAFDERNGEPGHGNYYQIGAEQIEQALKIVADCERANDWPGYPLDPVEMSIPRWAGFEGM